MARQSRLEKEGIQAREETVVLNFYQKGDNTTEYGTDHEDAKTHNDDSHPWGKGDPTFVGESFVVPDETKSKTEIKAQLNTLTGGGSYDINGRMGIGGRKYLNNINIYGPSNEYGTDSVDTSINVNDYEQYTVTTRGNGRD